MKAKLFLLATFVAALSFVGCNSDDTDQTLYLSSQQNEKISEEAPSATRLAFESGTLSIPDSPVYTGIQYVFSYTPPESLMWPGAKDTQTSLSIRKTGTNSGPVKRVSGKANVTFIHEFTEPGEYTVKGNIGYMHGSGLTMDFAEESRSVQINVIPTPEITNITLNGYNCYLTYDDILNYSISYTDNRKDKSKPLSIEWEVRGGALISGQGTTSAKIQYDGSTAASDSGFQYPVQTAVVRVSISTSSKEYRSDFLEVRPISKYRDLATLPISGRDITYHYTGNGNDGIGLMRVECSVDDSSAGVICSDLDMTLFFNSPGIKHITVKLVMEDSSYFTDSWELDVYPAIDIFHIDGDLQTGFYQTFSIPMSTIYGPYAVDSWGIKQKAFFNDSWDDAECHISYSDNHTLRVAFYSTGEYRIEAYKTEHYTMPPNIPMTRKTVISSKTFKVIGFQSRVIVSTDNTEPAETTEPGRIVRILGTEETFTVDNPSDGTIYTWYKNNIPVQESEDNTFTTTINELVMDIRCSADNNDYIIVHTSNIITVFGINPPSDPDPRDVGKVRQVRVN